MADPGFPVGHQPKGEVAQTYLAKISSKLHENDEKWAKGGGKGAGGGDRRKFVYVDRPLGGDVSPCHKCWISHSEGNQA